MSPKDFDSRSYFRPRTPVNTEAMRVSFSGANPQRHAEFPVPNGSLTFGIPKIINLNGKNQLTIPNTPHVFLVNDLHLTAPDAGQDVHLEDVGVLLCHGTRFGSQWLAADRQNLVDSVWFYNNWQKLQKDGMPPIAAIVSCSKGVERRGEFIEQLNGGTRVVYRDVETTALPDRYHWIPDVIFQRAGTVYVDDAEVSGSHVSMTVRSPRSAFVRVTPDQRSLRRV